MFIVVTTDDLRPETLHLFERYWKPLKEKHPDLKVTFYVSPFYQEFGIKEENDIYRSEEFFEWYEKNKDWVAIEIHGYDHTKEPENLRSYEEQKELIKKSLDVMRWYIDQECLGYKCPFYRGNSDTIKILTELGFSWYSNWWWLHPLKVIKKPMPYFMEFPTHTNGVEANNPDNIDLVYQHLDKKLTEYEEKGFEYSTFRDIIKKVLQ